MFEIITTDELIKRLGKYNHKEFHPHHVASPDHKTYNAKPDPLYWQTAMREFHVKVRGFADIAQHCTLLPDGRFVTGRDFGRQPASMTGQNGKNGDVFMIEMIGNFNVDKLEGLQKDAVMKLAKWFLDRGKIIKFHRDYASTDCPGKSIDKAKFIAEAKTWGDKKLEFLNEVKGVTEMLLKQGSKGVEVKKLQADLTTLGYNTKGVDGIFGSGTAYAVTVFQRDNKLPQDGIAGVNTLKAIETVLSTQKVIPNPEIAVLKSKIVALEKTIGLYQKQLAAIKNIVEGK